MLHLDAKNATPSLFPGAKTHWHCCITSHTTSLHLPDISASHRNDEVWSWSKEPSPRPGYSLHPLWDKSVLRLKCPSLLPARPACTLCLSFCVVLCALEPSCVAVGRYCSSSTSDCVALRDGWCGWAGAGEVAICQE